MNPKKYTCFAESVITVCNEKEQLTAIIYRDPASGLNSVFSCERMSDTEIATLITGQSMPMTGRSASSKNPLNLEVDDEVSKIFNNKK